jgi:hypothetical protein
MDLIQDLVVTKSQHTEAMIFKDGFAFTIGLCLFRVDRTVDLDNQLCGRAIEINDEATYCVLTAEAQARDLISPKMLP